MRTVAMMLSALLSSSLVWSAHAQEIRSTTNPDAADRVLLGSGVRSVHVVREGEVVHVRADVHSARRGTLALDARVPALEAALGPGCSLRWIRIGVDAWVCQDGIEFSREDATQWSVPALPANALLPYRYAFARHSGSAVYRSLDDAQDDARAGELERGMGLAIDASAQRGGQTYFHTASQRWISASEIHWASLSYFHGITLESRETTDSFGFTSAATDAWPTIEQAAHGHNRANATLLPARTGIHIREQSNVGRRSYVRTDQGWIAASSLRRFNAATPPRDLRPNERWVDVDRAHQILVAFEGTHPVYATLVSSGRSASPTRAGEFRAWVKLAFTTMANTDRDDVEDIHQLYSVENVPWVLFFHNDQALHGAYWHDHFGAVHSHGCVNLAPADARWIFEWAPPLMPPGWSAIFPTTNDPGLRVRVR